VAQALAAGVRERRTVECPSELAAYVGASGARAWRSRACAARAGPRMERRRRAVQALAWAGAGRVARAARAERGHGTEVGVGVSGYGGWRQSADARARRGHVRSWRRRS
jgi:hypothetical protein